jgi:inner membrane protein
MPTVLSHPAVPLALGLALGSNVVPRRLLICGVIASVVPDLDVLAFRVGIGYSHEFGHRGFSHSLFFALVIAIAAAIGLSNYCGVSKKRTFLFVLVAAASHGLLDMLTNGGLGVALFWPVIDDRYFFPVQVIEASPLSLRRLFGAEGVSVGLSELLWVWLPSAIAGLAIFTLRRKNAL